MIKQLLKTLTAIAILSLIAISAVQAQGLPAAEVTWPEGKSTITIPFNYDAGLIVIQVSVMGSRFISTQASAEP